ncbi:MAG: RNA methyltransferase [Gemmatimonadetes bacterium]|nr:RNA methyltransferase [Gemmatimonadota bacterium]MBT7864305.1 RNA methyltransferase [Gemmatimonadota bacterium]
MNVILFAEGELATPLPRQDPRAAHIVEVLGFGIGDTLDVGLINGPMGKARITAVDEREMGLAFEFTQVTEALHPVSMIIGLPRPPSCRRMLKDLTTLGVGELHFTATDKGEQSYLKSRLWAGGEYERLLLEGAQQAFSTRLPEVRLHDSVAACLESLTGATDRLALDNYEATHSLRSYEPVAKHCTLAVGSERGWSAAERDLLRDQSFELMHMGPRVLKTETACIAGLAIVLEKLRVF